MDVPEIIYPDKLDVIFDNDFLSWTLPSNEKVYGWVSGVNTHRSYVYLWYNDDCLVENQTGPVGYRVFPFGQPDGEWKPFSASSEIIRPTADDPEPISSEDPQFGAKFKLPVGRYSFELQITFGGKPVKLTGGEFRVFRSQTECTKFVQEQIRLYHARRTGS